MAPNTSITSFGSIWISVLIENADIEDLIKVYQAAKKHDFVYIHIQEFLTRIGLYILSCYFLSLLSQFCNSCHMVCFSFALSCHCEAF